MAPDEMRDDTRSSPFDSPLAHQLHRTHAFRLDSGMVLTQAVLISPDNHIITISFCQDFTAQIKSCASCTSLTARTSYSASIVTYVLQTSFRNGNDRDAHPYGGSVLDLVYGEESVAAQQVGRGQAL